jgi:gamma-glutamyltranspeptidase/glutathione hydrolase
MRTNIYKTFTIFAIFSFFILSTAKGAEFAERRIFAESGSFGAAATGHQHATRAAADVLKNGGNAIDAAVTAAFILGVVDFTNSGPGGDAHALVHLADGRIIAFDAAIVKPALADKNNSYIGLPTQPELQLKLLRLFGTMSPEEVIAPAINLCEKGFLVSGYLNHVIKKKLLNINDKAAIDFLAPDGFALPAGSLLKQPLLARTLKQMSKDSGASFYRGEHARILCRQMQQKGSSYTREDFAKYRSKIKRPLRYEWQSFSLFGNPPPSSSIVAIKIAFMLLNSKVQIFKNKADQLIKAAIIGRQTIDFKYNKLASYANNPNGFFKTKPAAPECLANIQNRTEGSQTTHVCTWDQNGNAVSMTLTLGSHCGSGDFSELGFFYNNQMRNYTSQVAIHPDDYPENTGPISSKAPIMVKKDGQLYFILGGAGSDRIIFNNAMITTALISGMTRPFSTVNQPRFFLDYKNRLHLEWSKDSEFTKQVCSIWPDTQIRESGADYFGMNALIIKQKGILTAISDFRRDSSCKAIDIKPEFNFKEKR